MFRMSSFYESHIVGGEILSRKSLKKFAIQRSDDGDEKDDQVFGTRFKYLTKQFILQLVPNELIEFFDTIQYELVGGIVLGLQSSTNLKTCTAQIYLDWLKKISHNKTHRFMKSRVLSQCSNVINSSVNYRLFEMPNEEMKRAFSKFLEEYRPLLGWSFVMRLFTSSRVLLLVNSLIEYATSDNFLDDKEQFLRSFTDYRLIYVLKNRQTFQSFYDLVIGATSKSKWREIIEIIDSGKIYNFDHAHNMLECGKNVLPLYMELMEVQSFDTIDWSSCNEFNENMLYLFKETSLISDDDLICLFHRCRFKDLSIFQQVIEACKKMPSFDIHGCEGNFNNWILVYLENQFSLSIQDMIHLVLEPEQVLDFNKLCNDNKEKRGLLMDYFSLFINEKLFPSKPQSINTQEVIYLHKKIHGLFTEDLFQAVIKNFLHLKGYRCFFNKDSAKLLLSLFDFDGLTVEQHVQKLRTLPELQHYTISNDLDFQKANNKNEVTLALYLTIAKLM